MEIQRHLVQVCGVFVMSRNQMHSVAAENMLKSGDRRGSARSLRMTNVQVSFTHHCLTSHANWAFC